MAYKPSSKFLQSLIPAQTGGYRPSASLISSLSGGENEEPKMTMEQRKQRLIDMTTPSDPLGIVSSMIYGVGKGGSNIAKMVNPNAPSMPDIRMGTPSRVAEAIGQYAPFGIAGGSSLAGSTAGAGTFGLTQHEPGQEGLIDRTLGLPKGGRVRSAIEDMLINLLTHGAGAGAQKVFGNKPQIPSVDFRSQAQFKPGESEFTNIPFQPPKFLTEEAPKPLSENIANQLHADITGKRSIEESGKDLANTVNNTYKKVHGAHVERYNNIFEQPTEQESAFTGEPFKVKEVRLDNSNYLKKYHGAEFKEEGLQKLHDQLIENPTTENFHRFQSELGSEVGYLQRQKSKDLLDDEGKNLLRKYSSMRDMTKSDLVEGLNNINPKLADEYNAVTESWKRNVTPYHSDKELRQIAEGKIKNPTSTQLVSIFKNPEENINTIVGHMPEQAKSRILHIASGKGSEENTAKDLLNARKSLEKKGFNSYIHPQYEQAFKNIRSNVHMEKEAATQAETNKKLIESLKSEQQRAEQARIAAAKTREKLRILAEKEATKANIAKKKELQKRYEDKIKEQQESQKIRSDRIRSVMGAAGGAALVHGFGIDPKDLLGGYLGKLITGKK